MKFRLDIAIYPRSPVFIGRSSDVLSADKSFEVDWKGRAVIPATSFRGRVRAQLESLANSVESLKSSCRPPKPEEMCKPDTAGPDPAPRACVACRIFGNPWLPSPIVVSDFVLSVAPRRTYAERITKVGGEDGQGDDRATSWQNTVLPAKLMRTHVSISRQTKTAAEERLFTFEIPGFCSDDARLCYVGTVTGDLAPGDLGLLLVAMKSVQRIGGGKGRGLGAVEKVALNAIAIAGEPSVYGDAAEDRARRLIEAALEGVMASARN